MMPIFSCLSCLEPDSSCLIFCSTFTVQYFLLIPAKMFSNSTDRSS